MIKYLDLRFFLFSSSIRSKCECTPTSYLVLAVFIHARSYPSLVLFLPCEALLARQGVTLFLGLRDVSLTVLFARCPLRDSFREILFAGFSLISLCEISQMLTDGWLAHV